MSMSLLHAWTHTDRLRINPSPKHVFSVETIQLTRQSQQLHTAMSQQTRSKTNNYPRDDSIDKETLKIHTLESHFLPLLQ